MMRLLLLYLLISLLIVAIVFLIDIMLGHRLLILFARAMRFKIDDVEKTEKKVEEILGDDYAEEKRKTKNTKRKSTKKRD